MFISGAAALAMQIAAVATPIGVGAASLDGQICVAMPTGGLTPGMTITLIQPDPPQSVLRATVVRPAPSCERLEQATIPGPYYLAQPPASTVLAAGTLWVAFPGSLGTRELTSGDMTVQLSPAYPNAHVRSCASQEGLHLTVWADTPLESDRLWHVYYYLGYDVDPSCDDRDARGPLERSPVNTLTNRTVENRSRVRLSFGRTERCSSGESLRS